MFKHLMNLLLVVEKESNSAYIYISLYLLQRGANNWFHLLLRSTYHQYSKSKRKIGWQRLLDHQQRGLMHCFESRLVSRTTAPATATATTDVSFGSLHILCQCCVSNFACACSLHILTLYISLSIADTLNNQIYYMQPPAITIPSTKAPPTQQYNYHNYNTNSTVLQFLQHQPQRHQHQQISGVKSTATLILCIYYADPSGSDCQCESYFFSQKSCKCNQKVVKMEYFKTDSADISLLTDQLQSILLNILFIMCRK